MEKVHHTPTKPDILDTENQNTPPILNQDFDQKSQGRPICSFSMTGTPERRLKVPKAFKYPERYTSPTDQLMSPVTRGILARSKKPSSKLLPPSAAIQPKIEAPQLQKLNLYPN